MRTSTLAFLTSAVFFLSACGYPASAPTATPAPPTPSGDGAVSATPAPPGSENPDVPAPPYAPAPSDDQLQRGAAFVDSSQIIVAESFPPQFFLGLTGSVPTPCHQLRAAVSAPGATHRIDVSVYSVVDPNAICTQVLAPFDVNVWLGAFPTGRYEVWVNGQPVGEIEAP